MKKKDKIALYINILIIILEIIGLSISINDSNRLLIEYYTEDSNILLLIASSIYVFYLLTKKEIPRWLNIFKHMATLGVTITFIVVILILAPMYNFNYGWILFYRTMLYHHTLCPILSIITFIFFENHKLNKKDIKYTMIFTLLYSVILIFLNILKLIEGPYPFLMVYKQPIYMSILWIILIDGGAYLLSIALSKISNNKT